MQVCDSTDLYCVELMHIPVNVYQQVTKNRSLNMSAPLTPTVGGNEYQFVTTKFDRWICKKCYLLTEDSFLSVCCGNNFCKSCAKSETCPHCHNKEFTTVSNIQADREVRRLHVFCTKKDRGCKWQGELNDLDTHLNSKDGCQFEDVLCPIGCGKVIHRQHITSHKKECTQSMYST